MATGITDAGGVWAREIHGARKTPKKQSLKIDISRTISLKK